LQGFHYLYSFLWAKSPMVLILQMDRQTLADSTAILHFLDGRAAPEARLFPDEPAARAEVERLEALFDSELGVHSRLWVYASYLPGSVDRILEIAAQGVPSWQPRLLKRLFPLMRRVLEWRLGGLQAARVADRLVRCRGVF